MAELPRILIVDDSRMVRATLVKHLRGSFDTREEVDGEAGWEALLVDPAIQVVISDLSMPKLDGYGLLGRIRGSKIARISEMPVIMISGDEDEESRALAKSHGATDFISKGIGTADLLARLDTLVKLARTSYLLQESQENTAVDALTGLPTRAMLLRQCAHSMAYAQRHHIEVSALVIGIDHFAEYVAEHGAPFRRELLKHFTKLLSGSMRQEDVLASYTHEQFAIASLGTSLKASCLFAHRLRMAVEAASIKYKGQSVRVTVSLGLANRSADSVANAEDLFTLANQRLHQAAQDGGNRIIAAAERHSPVAALHGIEQALVRLAAGDEAGVLGQLAPLASRMMPLLRLLEQEYRLGLPLAELEQKVAEKLSQMEN